MENIIIEKLESIDENQESIDARLKNIEDNLYLSKTVLNIEEVSRLIGLSVNAIYMRTSRGTIPHYKQGRLLFFNKVEVEEWQQENRGYNVREIEQQASVALVISHRKQKISA